MKFISSKPHQIMNPMYLSVIYNLDMLDYRLYDTLSLERNSKHEEEAWVHYIKKEAYMLLNYDVEKKIIKKKIEAGSECLPYSFIGAS